MPLSNEQTKEAKKKTAGLNPVSNPILSAKLGSFFYTATNERSFNSKSRKKMKAEKRERITRERLRAMKAGESITVECVDGYDLDSQKNTAYAMKKMENSRFSCKSDGLVLTVTKLGGVEIKRQVRTN